MPIWPDGDGVEFEWTGSGTGSVVAGSAVLHRRIPPATNDAQKGTYFIRHATLGEWEKSTGTWTDATQTLTRGEGRIIGSNGASLVPFPAAGLKIVSFVASGDDLHRILDEIDAPDGPGALIESLRRGIGVSIDPVAVPLEMSAWRGATTRWAPPSSTQRPLVGLDRLAIFNAATSDHLLPTVAPTLPSSNAVLIAACLRCDGAGLTGARVWLDAGTAGTAGFHSFVEAAGSTLRVTAFDPSGDVSFTVPGMLDDQFRAFALRVDRLGQAARLLTDVPGVESQSVAIGKTLPSWTAEVWASVGFATAGVGTLEVAGVLIADGTGMDLEDLKDALAYMRGLSPA